MTPEHEHVWIGYCDLCNGQHCVTIKAADAKVERRPHLHPEVRAALRERDARLLKLAAEWDEHAESVWNEEPHTAQDFTRCAKDLRALLEEAGK